MMENEHIEAFGMVAAALITFVLVTGITSLSALAEYYNIRGLEPFIAAGITLAIALVAIFVDDDKWIILPLSVVDIYVTFSAVFG